MQTSHNFAGLIDKPPTVLTIGTFDGMHLGHRRLIRSVVESAHGTGRRAALVTFFPHPRTVLGRAEPFYLTSNDEKIAELEGLGLDLTVIIEFTKDFARLHAPEFVDLLAERLNMREMWVGYDFALGSQREGDGNYLEELSAAHGYAFHKIEPLLLDGQPVSSTRIRNALRSGNVREANACLGRPFQITGQLAQNGWLNGAPDPHANLVVWSEHAVPHEGQYVCEARLPGTLERANAVVHVGAAHDHQNGLRAMRLHLPELNSGLFGSMLTLDLIDRQSSHGKARSYKPHVASR